MIFTTQRRRFVYDTWDNGNRLDRVMVECTSSITHCLRLNLQLHTIDLVRTCRVSSFCTVALQLARFQLTRRVARSLADSWASCVYRRASVLSKTSHIWLDWYIFDIHHPILILFGRNITEKGMIIIPTTICFPTSSNHCFYSTCKNENVTRIRIFRSYSAVCLLELCQNTTSRYVFHL